MLDILILIIIAIPIIYGIFTAGTPNQPQVNNNNCEHSNDPSMQLRHFSNLGYRLCFDQNLLLNRPDLLQRLPRTAKIGVSELITKTLKGHGKSSKYAFLTKSIISNIQEFEDLKICKVGSEYSLNNSASLSDIEDRAIMDSYLIDQSENLTHNLFVTDSEALWSNANRYGLKSILITEQ